MKRVPTFGLGPEFYTRRPTQRRFMVRCANPGAVHEFEVMALSAQEAIASVRAAGYRLAMVLP